MNFGWGRTGRIVLIAALLLMVAWCLTLGREPINRALAQLRQLGPAPFFTVFGLLICVGVPPTPFLLVAGGTFDLKTVCAGVFAAYSLSLVLSYYYTNRLFRGPMEKFMAAKAPAVAALVKENTVMAIVLVRLTPGFPYVLQNCLLAGVARGLGQYYLASLLPLVPLALLYASVGQTLLAGQYGRLGVLGFLLILVLLTLRIISCRRARRT